MARIVLGQCGGPGEEEEEGGYYSVWRQGGVEDGTKGAELKEKAWARRDLGGRWICRDVCFG